MVNVDKTKITITKLDAAQRQLQTAVLLWFTGGDPVSIHTLAYAAYEIIHAVSKRMNPNRRDLLFDSLVVKDEHRGDFNFVLKKHANFFKHGNKADETEIDFYPVASELFIMFSILGLSSCGAVRSDEEVAYLAWIQIHHPEFLTDKGRKVVGETISVESMEELRALNRQEFLKAIRYASNSMRRSGVTFRVPLDP